jgi:hypothetical protein
VTGINKRSNQPNAGQKKLNVSLNPLYNTSMIIKGVSDAIGKALGGEPKKKK